MSGNHSWITFHHFTTPCLLQERTSTPHGLSQDFQSFRFGTSTIRQYVQALNTSIFPPCALSVFDKSSFKIRE